MGSGLKSVPFPRLLHSISRVFEAAAAGRVHIATKAVPLSSIAEFWNAPGHPRIVFTLP
jgi:hypothetical protein